MNKIKLTAIQTVRSIYTKSKINANYNPDIRDKLEAEIKRENKKDFNKEDYVILGKYLKLFDTKRQKIKQEKQEERIRSYQLEKKVKIIKRNTIISEPSDNKIKLIQEHVKDTIDELLSSGFTPNSWLHPLFFQVVSISVNPSMDRVFVSWKATENEIYTKSEIEESIKKDLAKFKVQVEKRLRMFRNLNVRFSSEPSDIDSIENTLEQIENEYWRL
ncbi:hypothetical protein K502DRAFT_326718 [Neoconidiobolus thromboides FSU 785]|nr:hypothetical protein K502DRAFT_326718 [Neoconidiobolus thromboides FSU 785]